MTLRQTARKAGFSDRASSTVFSRPTSSLNIIFHHDKQQQT